MQKRFGIEHALRVDAAGQVEVTSRKTAGSSNGDGIGRPSSLTIQIPLFSACRPPTLDRMGWMIRILLDNSRQPRRSAHPVRLHVLNRRPPCSVRLGVAGQDDPLDALPLARRLLDLVDDGSGVLVLTDILGATPANIAAKLLEPGRVAGVGRQSANAAAGDHLPRTKHGCPVKGHRRRLRRRRPMVVTGNHKKEESARKEDSAMPRQEANIINKLGSTPASAKLTQVASAYACDVWLERNGRRVNAKSIMGVMMLAAAKGQHHRHRHRRR